MPWRFLRMEEHFELIKANFIRCEECNENFFFDFLRHPRYFVAHFKACHLKNLLYRFNGYSEEENLKTRFGPRRKRDANAWFGQLKSTEKRMISMQDNKWSEITENECWSCRLCNDGKADLTHVFELNELGRGQAFLHLRQFHEAAYEAFLQSLPDVQNAALISLRDGDVAEPSPSAAASSSSQRTPLPISTRTIQQRMAEAERSRLRRLRATNEERKTEAIRSKKRRENLTPVQRQADYERRKRKKKRAEESVRSKKRREDASKETKEKEVLRSRERRRNATEEQRQREALRSRLRRQNATEQQKLKERERCRKRYEAKKAGRASSSGQRTDDGGDSGQFSDTSSTGVSTAYASSIVSGEAPLRASAATPEGTRSGNMTVVSSLQIAQSMDAMQQQQHLLASQAFQNGGMPMVSTHQHTNSTSMNASTTRGHNVHPPSFQTHSMATYSQLPTEPRPPSNRLLAGPLFPPPQQTAAIMASGQADIQLGFAVNPNLQHMALQHDPQSHPFFFDNDASLLAGSGFASLPSGATRANQAGDSTAV